MANTQAYYDMITITAVKSFIVQTPVVFGSFHSDKLIGWVDKPLCKNSGQVIAIFMESERFCL